MPDEEVDTERVTVRTYVPAYQREEWDDHADELGMSRSEFVRSMVQAGRRNFDRGSSVEEPNPSSPDTGRGTDRGGEADLDTQVVETLSAGEYLSWEELLAAVTDDIEDRLEATLQRLQAADRVRYSGRNGGYTLDE